MFLLLPLLLFIWKNHLWIQALQNILCVSCFQTFFLPTWLVLILSFFLIQNCLNYKFLLYSLFSLSYLSPQLKCGHLLLKSFVWFLRTLVSLHLLHTVLYMWQVVSRQEYKYLIIAYSCSSSLFLLRAPSVKRVSFVINFILDFQVSQEQTLELKGKPLHIPPTISSLQTSWDCNALCSYHALLLYGLLYFCFSQ